LAALSLTLSLILLPKQTLLETRQS